MEISNTDAVCNIPHKINKEIRECGSDSLGMNLFKWMKQYSSQVFQYIADTDETDTYEQVFTRSVRTALKLRSKGIGRKDIISTCTYNHKDSCVPLLASFFIGAIPANFDPNLSHLDTIHLLKLLEPKIIFISPESVPLMTKCLGEAGTKTELVVFGKSDKYEEFDDYLVLHPGEENFKPIPVDGKETAIVMFSSGTTGLPKDAIANGDAKIVCSKFDPYEAWNIIEKYKVTSIFLGPHLANEFIHNRPKDVDVSSLGLFLTGGSPVTKELMDDLKRNLPNTTVLHGYGQTEAASCVSKFNPNDPEELEMQNKKPLSCGKIQPNFLWKVVDPATEEVLGPNERGELRLKNNLLMNGYYKMDSSSAYDSEGYLKTGDIVYYDDEDCLFIVDRIKEMFKYKGWHILPVILEGVLMSHPAVKEAAVIGLPHDIDGEHPMGFVVLYDGFIHVTPREIEKYVEERVPDVQRLRAGVKIVNEIPRTVTGKVKRSILKEKVLSGTI